MTRIDRSSTQAPVLDRTPAEDGAFQANVQSAASTGPTSAAGQVQASGWGIVPQPPLGGNRPPNEVFKNTNVMTMSESGPITFTFDGEEAAYNNSLVMLKLDARGNVIGTEPVFPDAENPGKSKEIDVKKGERLAFMNIPNGGASQATKDLLSDPNADLQLLNRSTGKPANLLTDKPEDIAYFSVDDCGKKTEIKGEGGLTFSVKRNPNDKGPDGKGFNSADIDVDPATGKVKVGMEDLIGGDNDLDDMNFTIDMGPKNAGGLVKPPRPGWPQEPPGGPGCPPEPPGHGPGWPPAPPGHGPGWPRPPAGDLPKTFEDVTGLDYKADRPELKATFEAFDGSVTGRKDGRVGPAEFAKVAPLIAMEGSDYGHFRDKGARTPDDFARALIREGDRDGDGQLSRSEFEALSRAVGPKKSGWE